MDNDLHTPIEQLLRSIPKIWGTFDIDSLSQAEQDALARLTAAGLVERRHRMRLRMISRNDGFDATFEATGCCGLIDALGGLLRQAFDEWETDFVAWKKRDDAAPPFVVECIQPSHWRLTTDGVLARSDLDADETARRCVFDFVLRQGIFDGKARLLDNKILHPPHVRGQGRLIACEKISEDARQAAVVNIGNFGPNGETLSQVLEHVSSQPLESVYCSIDCATRSITIGSKKFTITSENQWDFVRRLIQGLKDGELVPRLEGETDYKNSVDGLRRKLSRKNLHHIIISNNDGYKLHPSVNIINTGQIGIRRTKS